MSRGAKSREAVVVDHDFYEHLFLSEKIVGGRVRLELVRRLGRPFPHSSIVFDPPRIADVEVVSPTRHSFVPRHRPSLPLPSTYSSQPVADSSDDEEEMWRKWEARNRPSRATRRSAFGGENVRAAAGTTDGFSDATRMKSDGAFANDASSRRHQRQFRDKAYATLLIRSRRNSERVAESARKSQSRSARGADSYCRSGGGYEKNRKGARPDLRSPSISKLSPTRSIHGESFTRGTTRSASRPRHVSISANEASDSESSSDVSSDASVQSSDYQTEVSRRGRSASKEKSYASHETRQSVSPTSPFETRSLALALLENDLVLASAGYGAATSSSRKEFTAKATTTFNPPRLFTSSRPDQRLRSRAATAKAWAQRELVEAVVMHTTHSGGVDGVRHWDCPTRAAAEQAAANASGAFLSTHGDPGAARAAARAAARIAAAKAARFVERVGEGDGGKSYLVESETSRKQPRGGSSAKTKKEYTNNTMRALRDSMLSDSESETSISDSESEPHGLMLVRESLASVYRPPLVSDGDDGDMTHKKANQTNYSHADDDTTKSAEADVDAFADFREELAGLALGEKKNRPTRHLKAVSEPTSPRGGRVPTPRNGRKSSSRPNSARHGLRLVRETPASELEWATGNFDSGTKSVTKSKPRPDSAMALPSSAKARPTSALTLARHQSPLQTGGARNFSEFLRSGQGGAGMARGRSVAALEERTDPAHAARLRRQLETTVGPAMAAARAERAKAAARVGWAKANDRARAVEAADAETRRRFARRAARRDAEGRTFTSPLFGVPNGGAHRNQASETIRVVDAGHELDKSALKQPQSSRPNTARTQTSARPHSAAASSQFPGFPNLTPPAFSLTPISSVKPPRFANSPQSPFSPVQKVWPLAEAANNALAETAAAFAEAHRRAMAESPRNALRNASASRTPGNTTPAPRSAMKKTPVSSRPQSAHGKHGVQIVRESLATELEWARG